MAGVGLSSRLEGGDHVQSVESEKVQGVLSRLVTLEPRDLCNEAIVEKCRATRDLRSCGRIVEHSLNSCNHASLCAECVQRCDVCPICRAPIRSFGTPVRTRLYEDCCRAGMIRSRPGGATDADGHPNADVRRLWSFFDIALEYGLVSVIHHYVSDVCMDDMAVSSNATVSLLLDGTVVKDWCRRTLSHIIWNLHEIYGLGSAQMRYKEAQMGRFSALLLGLSEVLESLEGPYVNESSAPIIELQQLIEATRRVSQHLDVMSWCARHNFLEDLQSSHSSISEWRLAVKNRKLAATDRAWHGNIQGVRTDTDVRTSTLFIEDAMSNAGFGEDDENAFIWETLELQHLRQTTTLSSWRREGVGVMSNLHASGMLYPPESVRAAVDLIFLEASSDLILAKKAIFLYYLFDRHWPGTNNDWKSILDDYVVTFGISRHAMLESFVFFLLDEADDSALEEACCLLPEVVSSTIHPKVPRVLLERKRPFAALDVLRCSDGIGDVRFSGSAKNDEVSQLEDAVTAVRVRLECGLLTDAYLYQRAYISRIKSIEPKQSVLKSTGMNQHGSRDWSYEMESLVEEICWLCAEKCLVAQMIELPWDKDEERVLLNCLMNLATKDPCSSTGSLMVMFYIMRCRNQEAYLVHKELLAIEKTFLEQCKDMERNEIIKNICVQRSLLVVENVLMSCCFTNERPASYQSVVIGFKRRRV
ncbi:hypothetical protein KP509_36G007400 [Ceratopteris richardii]|uniref:RING-type domain-containing protein n=1 Tax=Ceratopteris richardii TaxID=49495 RepID=A0A8T2QAI7_CERRI|nr:hypothetical protein KP509_36G007400 [Ceratopteris richardii]